MSFLSGVKSHVKYYHYDTVIAGSTFLDGFIKERNKGHLVVNSFVNGPRCGFRLIFHCRLESRLRIYAIKHSHNEMYPYLYETYNLSQIKILAYVYGLTLKNNLGYHTVFKYTKLFNPLIILNGITYRLQDIYTFNKGKSSINVQLDAVTDIHRKVVEQIIRLYKGPRTDLDMILDYLILY